MKKFLLALIAFTTLTVSFTSCSTEDNLNIEPIEKLQKQEHPAVESSKEAIASAKIASYLGLKVKNNVNLSSRAPGGDISIICDEIIGGDEDVLKTRKTVWMDENGVYWSSFSWGGIINNTFMLADQTVAGAYAAC